MIPRVFRKLTTADGLGWSIVILAAAMFSNGIASSLRITEANAFFWFCLAAVSIGGGLRKIRLKGVHALMGISVSGILLVWILRANLSDPLLSFVRAVFQSIPQFMAAIRSNEAFDTRAIVEAWSVIQQSSSALWVRLEIWLEGFKRGVVVNDALVLSLLWTLLMWLCSGWMGWFAEKRDAIVSFLPSLALLAAVTSYSERRFDTLWVMIILLLFLMGIWNYRNRTLEWSAARIDYSDSIRFDIGQAAVLLTVTIGTLAFITPSISWRQIAEILRERRSGRDAAETLGIQSPPASTKPPGSQRPSLPRDYLLSGGAANSERLVMIIRTGELPPMPNVVVETDAPRYYWRSTVYDQYLGAGWATSAVTPQAFSPNSPLLPGFLNGYRLVRLDVKMAETERRLFWSGTLFSASIPLTANWRVRAPSDLFADQSELLQADLFAVLANVKSYQADAYVPAPSLHDLRSATAEYPEAIRERYLGLPSSVPDRVHDLARTITDGRSNPYERAKAIEIFLRTNFPYDLDVPLPPEGRDVVDYFLFDLKKGYCDYYATAMVVLARSSGLPARFVSGYSTGSYDAQNGQYVVRELNAHSWAEVYFPEIGWVEFEPTASQPEVERAEEIIPMSSDQVAEDDLFRLLAYFRMEHFLLWLSPLLLLTLAVLYFIFVERWLILRLDPETVLDRVYQRFYRAGRPIAGVWTPAETSTEFLNKLISGVDELQTLNYFSKLREIVNQNAIQLTDLYHASLFVDRRVTKQDAITGWRLWNHLRRQLLVTRLLVKVAKTARDEHGLK